MSPGFGFALSNWRSSFVLPRMKSGVPSTAPRADGYAAARCRTTVTTSAAVTAGPALVLGELELGAPARDRRTSPGSAFSAASPNRSSKPLIANLRIGGHRPASLVTRKTKRRLKDHPAPSVRTGRRRSGRSCGHVGSPRFEGPPGAHGRIGQAEIRPVVRLAPKSPNKAPEFATLRQPRTNHLDRRHRGSTRGHGPPPSPEARHARLRGRCSVGAKTPSMLPYQRLRGRRRAQCVPYHASDCRVHGTRGRSSSSA